MNFFREYIIPGQLLPGGGAYFDGPIFDLAEGVEEVTFSVIYVQASPTGAPTFRVSWGIGGVILLRDDISVGATPASPNVVVPFLLLEQEGPPGTNQYIIRICPPALLQVRLSIAETGDAANPGTVAILISGNGSG